MATDKVPDRSRDGNRRPDTRDTPNTAPDRSTEPAQGHIDTKARYRDRPTDDGKYGDGGDTPSW
jgi:hypothetical protein